MAANNIYLGFKYQTEEAFNYSNIFLLAELVKPALVGGDPMDRMVGYVKK